MDIYSNASVFQETRHYGEWAKINCDRNLLKTKPEPALFVNTFRSCIIISDKVEQKFSSKTAVHDRLIIC